MYNIIAEACSAVGAILLIASFQIKNTRIMFAVQCIANLLFCTNYLMFAQYTPAALMVLGMFSPVILLLTKGDNKFIKYGIMLIYVPVAVLTYGGILSIILCVAQMSYVMVQWTYKPRLIRAVRLCASPFWLWQNIGVGWFITGAELFTAVSIIVFLIRTRKSADI